MLTKKDRTIKNQKAMIENRDVFIKDLRKDKEALKEENKDLRFELDEARELIKNIHRFATGNKYNNEKVFVNKIKELVTDYQSANQF